MATISSTIELYDKMSEKLTKIEENVNGLKSTLKSIENEQSTIDNFSWATFLANAEQAGREMAQIGRNMTLAITAPLALLGKKMYTTATDYESAFAGVKKTVDATEEEYAQLYADLLGISETNPTGFVDAAGIMEMAGQLGVATDQLTKFTQTFIGLQESTNIQGEAGAADLARFLNVTQKTTANVDRVSGVIVGLGNNFATTEQEILSMATRMGATADIAGMHVAEILAFSAALSSVGINAEAGGSAAGKLMKKMQLAAEVGGRAQDLLNNKEIVIGYDPKTDQNVYLPKFYSGLDFTNYLDSISKADVVTIAEQLNMTTDAVQDMAKSWLALDQFSEVMGLDRAGFLESWDESAAKSMLAFFQGLGNLDPETGNSILAQLSEMDLTEIRLSNLIAAMSVNSDLFDQALSEAYRQYTMNPEENALTVEVNKRYETQESQNAMLGNKLQNTMADFGQNLVTALQPALDVVNQLLDKFNSLSETDQTRIIELMGALALTGPTLTAAGKTVEYVSKIASGIRKIHQSGKVISVLESLGGFFINTPVGNAMLLAGAAFAIGEALAAIPSNLDRILEGAVDIPITIDEDKYAEVTGQIEAVQAALNGLKAGEINPEYEKTSYAVSYGIGTDEMFGRALAYEAEKNNATINQIANDYAAQITDLETKMQNALSAGNEELAFDYSFQIAEIRLNADAAIGTARQEYSEKISDLFNGMASKYPEQAAVLEQAAQQYDLLYNIERWTNGFDLEYDAAVKVNPELDYDTFMDNQERQLMEAFAELGYGSMRDIEDMAWANGFTGVLAQLYDSLVADTAASLQTVSDNPILSTWLKSIIDNPALTENLDFTNLTGALEGLVKMLDFKQAVEQAQGENNNLTGAFGKYLVEGLANGVEENASLIAAPFTTVRDNALDALRAAFGIASPSTVMQVEGIYIPQGLAIGITDGAGAVIAAMAAVGTAGIVVIGGIINRENGEAIAAAFVDGVMDGLTFGRVEIDSPEVVFNPLSVALPDIDIPPLTFNLPEMDAVTIETPEINPVIFATPDMKAPDFELPEYEQLLIDLPDVDFSNMAVNADFSAFENEAYQAGANLSTQYGAGIQAGIGGAVAAIVALGAVVNASVMGSSAMAVQAANGIMNFSTGFGIGGNLASGMAAGVNSGAGAVAAAVARMVQNALAAGNAAAQIHSPSRLTYWAGDMMVQGYINAIRDGEPGLMAAVSDLTGNTAEIWIDPIQTNLEFSVDPITEGMERSLQSAESVIDGTMGHLVSYAEKAWNEAAWSDIAYFAALEHDQLLSDAEDSIKISEADIRKIRQLAEREVINQFTTAEIKVEMTNNNNIKSDMDLDGIADYLADVVQEKLEAAAEGVYK